MKKLLIGLDASDIFYFQSGVRIEGEPPGIRGDLTGVRGDLTHICGDLTFVRGDLTHICGDLTFVFGDLDACEITQEDRKRGVQIDELVK